MLNRKTIPEPKIVPISQAKPKKTRLVKDLRILRFDEFLIARSLRENSKIAYQRDIQYFLDWCDTPWSEVKPRQVTQFKSHLLRVEDNSRVLKDASVVRILGTLKNFYNWLLRSGYISSDPTLTIELPSIPEASANNLSTKVIEKIFAALETIKNSERNLALFGLLLHGLRASEVCGLNVEDYDGERVEIKKAKAGSTGTVPLEEWCILLLNDYLEWRKANVDEELEAKSALFVSYSNRNSGKRISYDSINKLCKQISKKINIKFNAHQLRHTFATNLILRGLNPYHAMTLMRHRSVSNFRRYTKAADKAAAEAEFNRVSGSKSILRDNSTTSD